MPEMPDSREKPKRKNSTSAEELGLTTASGLTPNHIGSPIRVEGRNVTLGPNGAAPMIHEGILESLRANRERVVVTIRPGAGTIRVVEVTW